MQVSLCQSLYILIVYVHYFHRKMLFEESVTDCHHPACNYMLKVDNRNTKTRCEICSKLTLNAQERRQWHRSGVFIVNFAF